MENPNAEGSLPYGIIGDDHSTISEKLDKYTGVVDWKYIKPHFESGALIYVDPTLPITEVGQALADDNTKKIQTWLKSGDLVKPSKPHADWWQKNNESFTALVVSPFVLIQPFDQQSPKKSQSNP